FGLRLGDKTFGSNEELIEKVKSG
ncbi:MAG: hypothetical protein RJA23_1141, partial [Bacteroidota bacterium]